MLLLHPGVLFKLVCTCHWAHCPCRCPSHAAALSTATICCCCLCCVHIDTCAAAASASTLLSYFLTITGCRTLICLIPVFLQQSTTRQGHSSECTMSRYAWTKGLCTGNHRLLQQVVWPLTWIFLQTFRLCMDMLNAKNKQKPHPST